MAELEPTEKPLVNRWPLGLAVAAGFALLFYLLQPILLPFVLGALVAYLGDPAVDWLERHRLNRTLSVVVVFLVYSALMGLALALLLPLLLQQLDALAHKVPVIYHWFTQVAVPWLQQRLAIPVDKLPALDWTGQLSENWQSVGKAVAQTLKKISGSGATLLLLVANLALVPVVAFYLMRDWDLLVDRALNVLPMTWQDKTSYMVAEANEVVGAFLRGQFLVMCALAVIYGAGLWLVGVQLALLLGLIAGLASIVPYLGFIVGITSTCFVAYAQYGEWGILLWVLLVFGIGQAIESMVLTPVLVGDRIGLHPVAVIFALMAGGQLAGFVGVLVALPVAAVIKVFLHHALNHYRASDIYGGS